MALHFRNFELRPRCVGSRTTALPSVGEHLRNAPPIFHVFWGVSTACVFVVLVMTLPMLLRFLVEGEKLRRIKRFVFVPAHVRLTMQILCLFPLLSILSWTSMIIIRQAVLCELLAYLYNMAVLFWFFELVISYLGGFERALYILQREPPWHVMRVPPLCCLNFCARQRQFTENDLRVTRFLIFQYAVIGPLIAVADAMNDSYLNILHYLRVCVTLLCMWGLVTIYRGSCRVLGNFHMGWKYVIIQATVVLTNFTTIIASNIVEGYDEVYTKEVMADAWVNFVFNFMMVPLTLVAVFAYPTQDIYLREKLVDELTRRLKSSPTDFDFYLGSHRGTFVVPDGDLEEGCYSQTEVTATSAKLETEQLESDVAEPAEGETRDSKTPLEEGDEVSAQSTREVQSASLPSRVGVEPHEIKYSKSVAHLACLPMPFERLKDKHHSIKSAASEDFDITNVSMEHPTSRERRSLASASPHSYRSPPSQGRNISLKRGDPRTPPRTILKRSSESHAVIRVSFTPEEHSRARTLASPPYAFSIHSNPEESTFTSPQLDTISNVFGKLSVLCDGTRSRRREENYDENEIECPSNVRPSNPLLNSLSSVSPLRHQLKRSD